MTSLRWLWLILAFVAQVAESADYAKDRWIKPDNRASIETHPIGYKFPIQWEGFSKSQIDHSMNKSKTANLYVAAWNPKISTFNESINNVSIDISSGKQSIDWTIKIDEKELSKTKEYCFVFVPAGKPYNLETHISSPRFRVQSKSTATTTSSSTTGSTTITNTAASSPNASSETKGLSTGAKAGIGVGVSIGGLATLAALGFLIFRRRNRPSPQEMESTPTGGYNQDPKTDPNGLPTAQTLSDDGQKAKPGSHELYALPAELGSTQNGR